VAKRLHPRISNLKGPSLGRPVTDDDGRTRFGRDRGASSRTVVGLLVAASLTVITVDAAGGDDSPVDRARTVVGNVIGPVESGTAVAVRPLRAAGGYLSSNDDLRADVARLAAQNSQLRSAAEQVSLDRNRLAELDGLTRTANETGYALVAARVVGMGPMQSFSRTVTIDAGSSSGVREDMTVLSNDGLVGRVISATRTTANVLLVLDTDSVVGGRLGSNMEIGFLRGRGVTGDRGRLDLDLVDNSVTPSTGDVVVTWGSQNGVPYVAGIPIGTVESVYSTPRELAKRAVIDPLVDFTSLDVVGVVVPRRTQGDRIVLNGSAKSGSRSGAQAGVRDGADEGEDNR
jgi:rod shape-determining protein MreC